MFLNKRIVIALVIFLDFEELCFDSPELCKSLDDSDIAFRKREKPKMAS
jgi:hypothetical protein